MIELLPLREITVEITGQCLQNCVHCSSGASVHSQEVLSKDEIIRIAYDFKELGGKKIELSGGEPLLHKDIGYLLQVLKEIGLKVNVFTSGALSKEDNCEDTMKAMVRLLRDNVVDKVVFSLHGANARTHDEIARSPGSFTNAVKFINQLVKEKVVVGLHFVPMSCNSEEFRDLVDFAAQLQIHDVSCLRFVPQGRGEENKESLVLDKEVVSHLVKLLVEEEKRKDIEVNVGSHLDFTFLIDQKAPKPCSAGITKCLVEANGDVLPCAVFKGMPDFIAGNIRESLTNVWTNSKIFEIFRKFDPKLLAGECSACKYLSTCKGRCPAQRIYDHGDFYAGPDNYCPKEIYEQKPSLGTSL